MSDIAINPVTRRVQFTGNTGTGPYAFTFNILVDGDIAVFKGTTELTLTTDYTVSINANGTGSITLTAALIASDVLTIIGGRELSRTTDFVTAGDLLASSLNEQLDSNVIMTQQLDEKLGRGLFVNPGDVFTDLELPLKDDRKGTVLGFNETTGDPEPGPTLSDVDSLANISADIKTLAEIQDGTVATDAITNVNTIRTDVSTVSGISSNVTTVAGNTSNINAVAGNNANITTVAGINSDVTTVSGISSDVTTVAADGADIGVVAGLSSDIITVSGVSTEIGRLGTADAVSDMNALSPAAVIADMDSLADNVSAISIVSDDIGNVIAVAVNAANINTVAADGADIGTVAGDISNVNTVATNITSVNTNATNITDIQNASANAATATTQAGIATTQAGIATTKASEASASEVAAEAAKVAAEAALDEFTDIYLGAKASDPTTDNDGNALTAGDQYFNTTINVLKIYNGSAWQAAAIDSSGFVETTGDTMTGDLSFGDNDKAIFGAGSDLQIYHTGSNSILKSLTGEFLLQGDGITLRGNSPTETMLTGDVNGAVTLHYDSLAKLATTATGVEITGTLTSEGLTVDGADTEAATSQLLKIRNSTTGEAATIGLYAKADNGGDGNAGSITFDAGADGTSANNQLRFSADHQTDTNPALTIAGNGDISFYEDTGTTPKFFWDASAEFLGIGTTSPKTELNIAANNSGQGAKLTIENSDTSITTNDIIGQINFYANDASTNGTGAKVNIKAIATSAAGSNTALTFGTSDTTSATAVEAMRIDSSGRVGIGTSSPGRRLTVKDSIPHISILANVNTQDCFLDFGDEDDDNRGRLVYANSDDSLAFYTAAAEAMRITNSGNVGIGTSSPSYRLDLGTVSNGTTLFNVTNGSNSNLRFKVEDGVSTIMNTGGSGALAFTSGGTTEAMRIDSSGSVGIGTSSPDVALHVESSVSGASTTVASLVNPNSSVVGTGARLWLSGTNATSRGTYVEGQVLDGGNGHALTFGTSASTAAPTERMRIDSSGNVGIGVAPARQVHMHNASGDNNFHITNSTTGSTAADGFSIVSQSTTNDVLFNQRETANMRFFTANDEKMRIDSSGNLLVGTTDTTPYNNNAGTSADQGFVVSGGRIYAATNSNSVSILNRTSTDGDIVQFRKDGSTVGSIGTIAGDLTIGDDDIGIRFDTGSGLVPWDLGANSTGGLSRDGAIDIGVASARFKDLYLSGDVITGGGGTGTTGEIQFVADSTRARIVGGYNSGGGGYIAFRTDTAGGTDLERARFNNAGNLAFTNGNGIDFSASQGSGASSSVLDDYEEGTFTPTAYGGSTAGTTTYAAQTGSYTKVGNTVNVDIYISWSAMTGTGNLLIGGLPFTSSSASNYYATGTVVPLLGFTWPSGKTQLNPIMSASNTSINIYGSATDSNSASAATDSEIVALAITLTYKV